MRFTNVAQATAAGVELARRLHAMLEEGNDGSGGVDLLRVSALNGDATQRQEEFDRLSAELQEIWDERTRLETMQATFERTRQIVDDGTTPRNRPAQPRGRERDHRSAGQRFTEDEGWQSYLASISAGGDVRRQTVIAGPRVSLPGPLASRSIRNAVMVEGDPDSGGAFLVPQETGIIVPLPGRETTLLDLVTVGDAISGESVRAVRMTSKNGSAAGVAESTSTETPDPANAASGVKPELDMNFEPVTWNVANIAGMVTASTRSLADVGVRGPAKRWKASIPSIRSTKPTRMTSRIWIHSCRPPARRSPNFSWRAGSGPMGMSSIQPTGSKSTSRGWSRIRTTRLLAPAPACCTAIPWC
jgi:hypothetical protein